MLVATMALPWASGHIFRSTTLDVRARLAGRMASQLTVESSGRVQIHPRAALSFGGQDTACWFSRPDVGNVALTRATTRCLRTGLLTIVSVSSVRDILRPFDLARGDLVLVGDRPTLIDRFDVGRFWVRPVMTGTALGRSRPRRSGSQPMRRKEPSAVCSSRPVKSPALARLSWSCSASVNATLRTTATRHQRSTTSSRTRVS